MFNELLWMAFEFFFATRGAEVVGLAFKINPEFCCFLARARRQASVERRDGNLKTTG